MKFTETHEWVRSEEGIGTVGITAFAQKELGDIVYLELPKVGASVKAGEEVAVLESTKSAIDIASPVSGTVVAINQAAVDNPALVNSDPEQAGWLFQVEISHLSELQDLLDQASYLAAVKEN